MTLSEWLEAGHGTVRKLHFKTELCRNTIKAARDGRRVAHATAVLISMATDGAVTVDSLREPRQN